MNKNPSSGRKTAKRRSRYQRDTENPPRMYVTERDLNIMNAVGDYRFLSGDQIKALFFHSASTAKDRLAKLWQAKFLERVYRPVLPTEGSPKALYALGREGAMLLAQRTGRDVSEFKHLTPKESKLLFAFMTHPGLVLTRGWLMREIWETEYTGDTRTLYVHVRWLREKIEEDPGTPRLLKTVRGVGYLFASLP